MDYAKPIRVCKDAWIGASVSIMPGVTIGQHSVVGSGSVVTADIPANVIACGNPCRVIRKIGEKDDNFMPENVKSKTTPALHKENAIKVEKERMFYRDFPSSPKDMPDFKEKFLALTKGLDAESIKTAVRAAWNRKQFSERDFIVQKGEYLLKRERNGDYCRVFFDALIPYKAEVFKYVQTYYRCFMGCKSVSLYPTFQL